LKYKRGKKMKNHKSVFVALAVMTAALSVTAFGGTPDNKAVFSHVDDLIQSVYSSHALMQENLDDAPDFVELQADKAAYAPGERAILVVHTRILPGNHVYEFYLAGTFNAEPIKITRISDTEAVAVTPYFAVPGQMVFSVDVYLQDKQLASDLNATVFYYESDKCRLARMLESETDPVKRRMLSDMMERDTAIIADAKAQLMENRRKLETKTLAVTVANKINLLSINNAPPLVIEKDAVGCGYQVGAHATFAVHVLTDFTGEDGPQENVVTARIGADRVSGTQGALRDFLFTTQAFTQADVGTRLFDATLYIRSKARADSLRGAIQKASVRRADLIAKRDATADAMWKAYYQHEIDDLTAVIAVFYRQLEGMLTFVGTKSLAFCITA